MAITSNPPEVVEQGGRINFSSINTPSEYGEPIKWEIVGVCTLTPEQDDLTRVWWDVPIDQQPGGYQVRLTLGPDGYTEYEDFQVRSRVSGVGVTMRRAGYEPTSDQAFWVAIRNSTQALSYDRYSTHMNEVMCTQLAPEFKARLKELASRRALPFPDVDQYRLIKVATEAFMMLHCGVYTHPPSEAGTAFDGIDVLEESLRLGVSAEGLLDAIKQLWRNYITGRQGDRLPGEKDIGMLPYLSVIRNRLPEVQLPLLDDPDADLVGRRCYGILREKLLHPCLVELIWNYWHEEGMLVQAVNALTLRFQNILGARHPDPLAELEADPLRPLSNLLWGFVQDEQHRLTIPRRAYEYDHHYGLTILGRAAPQVRSADSRSRFLEAFHTVLNEAALFYTRDDDTTVVADGFPLLNALKDVHLLLTEGQHNQYGDLPWQARQEMLMQQWLFAQPEVRQFLPGRAMVDYPEPWMDAVDAMKRLQGWTDTSIMHFRDLGVFGEQILLSIRYGGWNRVIEAGHAKNWARYWRPEVQGYIHSYRAVTGVDLTADEVDTTMPAVHLQRRLREQLEGVVSRRPIVTGQSRAALERGESPRRGMPAPARRSLPSGFDRR